MCPKKTFKIVTGRKIRFTKNQTLNNPSSTLHSRGPNMWQILSGYTLGHDTVHTVLQVHCFSICRYIRNNSWEWSCHEWTSKSGMNWQYGLSEVGGSFDNIYPMIHLFYQNRKQQLTKHSKWRTKTEATTFFQQWWEQNVNFKWCFTF
jgi:hypothetical protein